MMIPSGNREGVALAGLRIVALAVVYWAAAKFGLSMAFAAEQVTAVWPPMGIALAALVFFGPRVSPGIWLGAFAANITANEPLLVAAGIASGNTLEPLLGAWLLRRSGRFSPTLERVRDVLALAVLAAPLGAALGATIGVTSLCLGGVQGWDRFGLLWLVWWVGDGMGALLWAPPLLVWGARARGRPRQRAGEAAALLLALAVVGHLLFGARFGAIDLRQSPAYVVFPFVIWAALRLGQPITTLALLLVSILGIRGTVAELGPFVSDTVNQSLILLLVFLSVVAVTGLSLGAAIAERRLAEQRRAADYAVTQALAQGEDLEAGRIVAAIGENLGWDVGALWRVDPGHGVLRCVEVWRRPGMDADRFQEVTRARSFAPGVGLPGRVWSTGQPAWIEDVARDANFARAPFAAQEGLHGAFGFPIVLGTEVLGVIEFFTREIRPPDDDLLRMVATVGSQVGQFLDRRRAEKERAHLVTELKKASEAKDQFLAVLGHELRNPLAPIRTALEVLRTSAPDDPAVVRMHEMMQRQIQHLVRLVDDLLDVSRITRGKIELRKERVELGRLVKQAIAVHQALIDNRGQRLSLSPPAEPVEVDADPTRLEQVVGNLVANAARYSERGREIRVAVGREGNEAVVRVADDGVGIRPEMLERIFDPFTQADRAPQRVQEGLGIGLTVVKSLVEMHGGTVSVQSEGPGRGSAFTVRLPLAPVAAAAGPRPGAAARPPGESLRVLVVDDNADAAESLALLLQQAGHEVEIAPDGAAALGVVLQRPPQVVLLDIGLPGMDGYEVARRLRGEAALRGVFLVALTGFGQASDRRRAEEAGFDRHLVKPVDPADLHALLAGVEPARGVDT